MATFAEKNWGDCSKAIAYEFNFVQMCYGYDSDCYDDYYNLCPKCGYATTQARDYEYPKSGFSKKDYYLLDTYDFGVSHKLKEQLISFGISEENFRPIFTRKHDIILGFHLTPVHTLDSIEKINNIKSKIRCNYCNRIEYEWPEEHLAVYDRLGYPLYVSENELTQINTHHIVKTFEQHDVIISLELYNLLLKNYPRIECRPVFLGDITNDPEYIRLHKNELKKKALR